TLCMNHGCRSAGDIHIRLQCLRAMNISLRELQGKRFSGVYADAPGITIKSWLIEIIAHFIRLTTIENAAFHLHYLITKAYGAYPERDVRSILPVVSQRSIGIIHCGQTVHKH